MKKTKYISNKTACRKLGINRNRLHVLRTEGRIKSAECVCGGTVYELASVLEYRRTRKNGRPANKVTQ